ncbi:LmeA family phospholipid-binding protein [Gordonia araii]|uniref:LmeA family phospholipid-binding protein n=1 Tax=Gordonia araii TaxID=263909 RepID=UPI0014784682|nr:DUF2993 domain-containing protein [Gordonia araii]NNG96425.1 DUF2993 domain-containing protein [Gordonia araii NBRC 100433]
MTVDTLRAARSERELATALRSAPRVVFEPEVTLGGFPYSTHARRGDFPGLTITARGIAVGGPADLRGVPQTCATTTCWAELGVQAGGIRADAAHRWHGWAPVNLRDVQAYAKLDSVNLGRMLDITDLAVNTPAPTDRAGGGGPGDGLLERSSGVLLTGTVSLPPHRPSPRTDSRYPPSAQKFDGERVRVSVTVDLSVVDGDLVITATDFYTGPEEHARADVAPQHRRAVLQRFSSRVPFPRLPWGVVPTTANSAGSDVLISGKAARLTVAPDQF